MKSQAPHHLFLRFEAKEEKNWRRAVGKKYAGDKDLLAVFAEVQKLREVDRMDDRCQHSKRKV